jgi:hypothetical protein
MATIHSYQDIHFDVDLIDAARKQVEFLHLVDKQKSNQIIHFIFPSQCISY